MLNLSESKVNQKKEEIFNELKLEVRNLYMEHGLTLNEEYITQVASSQKR